MGKLVSMTTPGPYVEGYSGVGADEGRAGCLRGYCAIKRDGGNDAYCFICYYHVAPGLRDVCCSELPAAFISGAEKDCPALRTTEQKESTASGMHIIRSDCDISVGGWNGEYVAAHIPFVTFLQARPVSLLFPSDVIYPFAHIPVFHPVRGNFYNPDVELRGKLGLPHFLE